MDKTSNIKHQTLMPVKLSIVVPIYNVEQYLRKCVDSLLAQDYNDYEIILVDDGSTDSCPAICDEYASKYHTSHIKHHTCTIRVIHQENGGLSAARNTGIKAARGTYLCFVDSDDYWEENVLGGLMAQVEREDLDVLRFNYQNVQLVKGEGGNGLTDERAYEVFQPYKRDHRLDNDYSALPLDGLSFLNYRMSTACYAVMFIVRRELLNDCVFTEGIYFEDTDWTPRMLARAKRVASTDTIVYNYLIRAGSITKSVEQSKKRKVLDDKLRLIETLQKLSKELQMQGQNNWWFGKMIADTVISIIGILGVQFYADKKSYLQRLQQLDVFPVQSNILKAKLINISPCMAIELLHLKNRK